MHEKLIAELDAMPADSPNRRMILGIQAERLAHLMGEKGDAEQVMGHIIKQLEADAMTSMRALIANPDLTSVEAQVAHFDARVGFELITRINALISDVAAAAAQIQENPEV